MPRIGVLALQGDVREHLRALRALGADARGVRRAEEIAACDGLVLPGGESTTIGRLAVRFQVMDALRAHVAAGRPVLGTCAGMVLLADRVLDATPAQADGSELVGGLDVTVRRNAFGRQVDSFETTVRLRARGPHARRAGEDDARVPAVFIRAPWVESVGDGVEVVARVEDAHAPPGAAGRIVAVRQGALLATSFHPEIGDDPVVHRLFLRSLGTGAARADPGVGDAPA